MEKTMNAGLLKHPAVPTKTAEPETRLTNGRVKLRTASIGMRALPDAALEVAPGTEAGPHGSLHEVLMEPYSAFTDSGLTSVTARGRRRDAAFVGANHSAGVRDVWMSRPIRL
jgi:hypothetical protein